MPFKTAEDKDHFSGRAATLFKWTIWKKLTFKEDCVYYQMFEEDRYLIENEAGLSYKLGSRFEVKFTHTFKYDSDPPEEGVSDTDMIYTVGGKIKF